MSKGKALVAELVHNCSCCSEPQELGIAKDAPWGICPATREVYEIQEGKAVRRSDLELVGKVNIVESKTGRQVFPVPPPSTDELLNKTRDESAGEKQPEPTPTGVKVGDADYY